MTENYVYARLKPGHPLPYGNHAGDVLRLRRVVSYVDDRGFQWFSDELEFLNEDGEATDA